MSQDSLFRELGTIAFDFDIMELMIQFGGIDENNFQIIKELNPHNLELRPWLSLVPEKYLEITIQVAQTIFDQINLQLATNSLRLQFIGQIRAEILSRIRNDLLSL